MPARRMPDGESRLRTSVAIGAMFGSKAIVLSGW
jgi:hypothetical protein